jgi:hypothetical protein
LIWDPFSFRKLEICFTLFLSTSSTRIIARSFPSPISTRQLISTVSCGTYYII